MFNRLLILMCVAAAVLALPAVSMADEPIVYDGEVVATASTGKFAPLYMSALTHGVVSQGSNAIVGAGFHRYIDTLSRFSWGYGARAYVGVGSSVDYERFHPADGAESPTYWSGHPEHPAPIWLQELYAQVKYRGVYLTVGMEEKASPLLDNYLTSGDLIRSGNTRPLPGVAAGFIDFQDIPFTNGWVQINGEINYYRYTDSDWWADRFNYYYGHVVSGQYGIYRRCYFRSKPSERFSVTAGAQCASQFGGTAHYYVDGKMYRTNKYPAGFKDFVKMFWPIEDGTEGFTQGNTLGSWDFKARYRMRDDSELSAYFQWPWEDGSGIGKLNGLDGLWGVEYRFPERSTLVKAVVMEVLSFTNQSGPIHWAPGDYPGTSITDQATGSDDYYNNVFYNPYAVYGLSQGTPMMMAPIYNTDGYMAFIGTRMKGIHFAVEGTVGRSLDYRVKIGHRKTWGSGYIPLPHPLKATSGMIEARYRSQRVDGLAYRLQLAFDSGDMPQNSFGAMLSITYNGLLTLRK